MNEEGRMSAEAFAESLCGAKALLIGAGAGMGVDSGLPDFRGTFGFWKAYPPLQKLGIRFEEMANPLWFSESPELAWGFYGHRLNLYRRTKPHTGFSILLQWINEQNLSPFVFTSNVDGQFQQSGFPAHWINECHGSLMHLQCIDPCGQPIWPVDPQMRIDIDKKTLLARRPLPSCPGCGGLARPNILMFSDLGWDPKRTNVQNKRLDQWLLGSGDSRLCIIELGAGASIPTVRLTCEEIWKSTGGTLLRINPRDPEVPKGAYSLPMGAESALRTIEEVRTGG